MYFYLLLIPKLSTFFVGESKNKSTAEVRHLKDDYSKALGIVNVNEYDYEIFWQKVDIPYSKNSDKKIHKLFKNSPNYKHNDRGGSNEIFRAVGLGVDKQKILHDFEHFTKKAFNKVNIKRESVYLRPYQERFLLKIRSAFDEGFKSFLLFAKMRAGKSVMTLSHIVEANYQTSLIICRHNSPEQSWKNDPLKFKEFSNIRFLRLGSKNWEKISKEYLSDGCQVILYTTAQYLAPKIDVLNDFNIDFVIFDEAHQGGNADQCVLIQQKYHAAKQLYISGTAFNLLPDFTPDNRFIYSYYDHVCEANQRNEKVERMRLVPVSYYTEFKKYHPDAPDLISNVFLLNDDKTDFLYPSLVSAWIEKFLVVGNDPLILASQYTLNQVKHIYCSLPSQDSCDLMVKYVNKSKSHYVPLSCHGKSGVRAEEIKSHLEKYENTICFTVSANVLGVTAPWDCIIFLSTGESVSSWAQFAFRANSIPNKNFLVIDFDAERAIRAMRTYYNVTTTDSSQVLKTYYLDFFSIFGWNQGFSQELDSDYVDSLLTADITSVSGVCRGVYINTKKLKNFDVPYEIKKRGAEKILKKLINSNQMNNQSAKKVDSAKNESKDDLLKEKQEIITTFFSRFSKVILLEQLSGKRISNVQSLLQSSVFEGIVGVSIDFMQSIFDEEIINVRDMNSRISDTDSSIAKNLSNNLVKALEAVSNPDGIHRPIPEQSFCAIMN